MLMCNESLICISCVKEQIPYIAHFEKNWATKAIAQQFIMNKCNNSHKNQWTKPPEKYSHLQANTTKCSANGSCKKNGPMYRAPIAIVGGNEYELDKGEITQLGFNDVENSDKEAEENGSEDD